MFDDRVIMYNIQIKLILLYLKLHFHSLVPT